MVSKMSGKKGFDFRGMVKPLVFICRHLALLALCHMSSRQATERLKTKAEEFTRLAYTGLLGGLEHLKTETRLLDEKIANTMGWTVFEHSSVTSILVRKLA